MLFKAILTFISSEFEDEKRNMQFPSKITIRRSICFLTSGLNFKGARECPTDLFRIKT